MKKTTLVLALSSLVQLASNGQWTEDYLSDARYLMGSTVVGTKIFYAGGAFDESLSIMDIYDSETGLTTSTNMSVERYVTSVTNSGNEVLIAGGINNLGEVTDVVDIYNTTSQVWTVAQLSLGRYAISAVSNGTVALFAGGTSFPPPDSSYANVDIYDGSIGTWTTADLSIPRGFMGAVVAGNKAFFAGGFTEGGGVTDRVDIYDFVSGMWSTATLSLPRWALTAAVAGNKVLFAGGQDGVGVGSDRVDIYDMITDTWSTASLSVGRAFPVGPSAASTCGGGKAVFVGGTLLNATGGLAADYSEIDVYDGTTGTWSVTQLPYDLVGHSTNAIGDQIFVAGGGTLVGSFVQLYSAILIWENGCTVGINDITGISPRFTVFPNPADDQLTITLEGMHGANYQMIDAAGRMVQQGRMSGERTVLATAQLDRGVYVLRVERDGVIANQRIVLQ